MLLHCLLEKGAFLPCHIPAAQTLATAKEAGLITASCATVTNLLSKFCARPDVMEEAVEDHRLALPRTVWNSRCLLHAWEPGPLQRQQESSQPPGGPA